MTKADTPELGPKALFRLPGSGWFASFGDAAPSDLKGYDCRQVSADDRTRKLYLASEVDSDAPVCAQRSGCAVIFDGALYIRDDLRKELADSLPPLGENDAELLIAGYLRWGEGLLPRLRGTFALIIWDSAREIMLCVRDPLGSCPMFYAEANHQFLVATSMSGLLRRPHVSGVLNRAVIADHLVDRFPKLEETFYQSVNRVPSGHVLVVTREERSSHRYWDPAPDGQVNWLTADEVERFDELLDNAVGRSLSFGRAGIFLSGGLDSVSVAAVAASRSRARGLPQPLALSLAFPEPINEEVVQRSVASQLDLTQVVKPFYEATGATGLKGLLAPGLELSSSLSSPLMNPWLPAYYELAREGKRRGCQAILTGGGGDEWLCIGPYLAADFLRAFDLGGFYQLWQSERRSYRRSSLALLWGLFWRFGAQALLLPPAHRFLKRSAPWALDLRHRLWPGTAPWMPPKWLAPDPQLRRQLDVRREESGNDNHPASGSFYTNEMRKALDHSLVSFDLEENFEVYQRAGVRLLQPFWDADLIDLLYRTPPLLLNRDGRTKGLVRASLARRFPKLGFEQQRKVVASNFYASAIYNDGSEVWQQMGGLRALADLGIVEAKSLGSVLERFLQTGPDLQAAYRFWNVLNLESWARAHVS